MTYTAAVMFEGDLYEVATRVARDTADELTKAQQGASRAAVYARAAERAAELGWYGVLVPEAHGGAGGSCRDVCALAEATARHALALPVVDACAVAPTLISAADLPLACAHVADGTWRVASALRSEALVGDALRGGGYVVSGASRNVDITAAPTHFLVACRVRSGASTEPGLLLVPADSAGVSATRYEGMDGRQSADLRFGECPVDGIAVIARGESVSEAIDRATLLGATITCVTVVAAIGALLEETIRHLTTRVQFGSRLSEFQVLRHKAAEIYVGYENLRALATALVEEADVASSKWRREVSLAKLYAGELARFAAHACIQLHGAMGMTEELLAARLARRLLMTEFEFGNATEHRSRLARLRVSGQGAVARTA